MDAWHQDARATVYHGDCLEVLRALPDASVDAVVTDPPYGLEFMGKDWDRFGVDRKQPGDDGYTNGPGPYGRAKVRYGSAASYGGDNLGAMTAFQAWAELWAVECLRVLKPGGHLLAFGGTRTWHRLACAIEDAGFEVRDSIAWMYGSGFPKSLDVSKAIDKAAGAEREVVGIERTPFKVDNARDNATAYMSAVTGDTRPMAEDGYQLKVTTAPATDAAREWSGWGTALKPAHEPIVVARKPLVGTVAANVLEHGTGALNIDACRIAADGGRPLILSKSEPSTGILGNGLNGSSHGGATTQGRWPANVVLDEDQAAELDQQSGVSSSPATYTRSTAVANLDAYGEGMGRKTAGETMQGYGDSGGASRFFYVAKAPARERPKVDGTAHPTVKPLTLMRWLCRLVTPPDGVILEPFAGSGTTVEAALLEGFRVVAIEREADYLPLIQARLDRVAAQEPEDEQLTLDASA